MISMTKRKKSDIPQKPSAGGFPIVDIGAEQTPCIPLSRHESLLAAVPDIIMEVDNHKVYRWANQAGLRFFGEDVVGKEASFYFDGEQKVYDTVSPLFNGDEQVIYVESWQRRKDGQRRLLAWWCRTLKDTQGVVIGALSTARDITEHKQNETDRKKVEDALRMSEALLSETERIGKVGGWSFNIDTMAQKWTNEVYRIHEIEITPNPTIEAGINYYTPASRPIIEQAVQRAIAHGEEFDLELEIITAKGNTRSVHTIGKVDLKNRRIYGFFQDITEHKRAEEKYRTLFREMMNGFALHEILCDATGKPVNYRFLAVNPAFEHMTGLRATDIVGRTVMEVMPTTEPHWIDTFGRVALSGKPALFENHAASLGKTFKVTAFRPASGQFACIFEDITERMRIETYREMGSDILEILTKPLDSQEAIKQVLAVLKTRTEADAVGLRLQEGDDFPYFAQDGFSNDFLLTENTLVERGKDGGVCRDKDGNVCLECTCGVVLSGKTDPANPLFTKGGSFWINDSFPLLDLPSHQDPRLHPRNNCIHQGYASVALIPVRNKDRIVGLLQLNDKRKGRFTLETIEILESIAAHIGSALMRKQGEAREVVLREKLERAARMESLGVLAGGVAHDLNNILGPMVLLPEIIADYIQQRRDPSDSDYQDVMEALDVIEVSARRATAVVSDLVVMGRRGQFQKEPVDLNRVVDHTLHSKQLLDTQKRRPDVLIRSQTLAESVWCEGSESRLIRVLANLAGNAAEAIEGKGDVMVTAARRVLSNAHTGFETVPPGRYAVLEVTDTGCGMDAATMARICEPFFSTKPPSERSGSGLGLSVVYGLVKDHGGFLDVRSEPGQGTTFTVYLPASPGATPETAAPLPVYGGQERILVVDDEPGQQASLRVSFRRLGYAVTTVSSGEQALSLFQASHQQDQPAPFDLVLTDMIMKGMNGLSLCKAIFDLYPGQKMMVTSGYSPADFKNEIKDLGIDWLCKPFTSADLGRAVRSRLDQNK